MVSADEGWVERPCVLDSVCGSLEIVRPDEGWVEVSCDCNIICAGFLVDEV